MYKKRDPKQGAYNRPHEEGKERNGPPRRLLPPPPRTAKEDIVVTLETPIPAMPEKHQLLSKPNWEANFKKDYDVYYDEIRKIREEKVRLPAS